MRKTNKDNSKVFYISLVKYWKLVVNLKTLKEHTHLFDSDRELNPADGKLTEFFNVDLEDNYSFDSTNLRYRLSTPNTP